MKYRLKIYPSEIGRCELAYWFEVNEFSKSPNHIKSYIGSISHDYAEQLIKDGEVKEKKVKKIEEDREEGNQHLDKVLDQAYAGAERYIDPINEWIKTTDLLDDHDTNFILDFKTGKQRLFKATKIQLGAYYWLMNNSITPPPNGLHSEVRLQANLNKGFIMSGRLDLYNKVDDSGEYKMYVIYLGDVDAKVVRELNPREIKECKSLFDFELPRTIDIRERIHRDNWRPPCPSWCQIPQFCSYRHWCVGI